MGTEVVNLEQDCRARRTVKAAQLALRFGTSPGKPLG